MVAIMLGADNGFFYAGQVMHFSSPFTVFLIYHKHYNGLYKYACTIRRIHFIPVFNKKLKKLFIAPKVRQKLYETGFYDFLSRKS